MRTSQHATHGYAIADAQHILKAANKHWTALQALGTTDAERKRLTASIAQALKMVGTDNSGPIALEEARHDLKEAIGAYRSAAILVVNGIDGRDVKAESALKMKGPFPATDLQLAAYVDGLSQRMKSYVNKLSGRGFNKENQNQLVDAGTAFRAAFSARGKERGEARAETVARDAVFKQLRTETSYFRRLGNEALRSTTARADFDRVKLPGKAPVPAPAPAP
jgi:hypothetical protein